MPALTARALAWIAEAADGTRDVNRVLVQNADGKLALVDEIDANGRPIILEIRTPSRKKQVRKDWKLTIPKEWDALFLTESAVEKFLFPYYESQRLLNGSEMELLKGQYYNRPDVAGILHKPPSRPSLLLVDGSIVDLEIGISLPIDIPTLTGEEEAK